MTKEWEHSPTLELEQCTVPATQLQNQSTRVPLSMCSHIYYIL